MGSEYPSYTVVIGSSAGGLEALSEFLNHLPNIDSLAVIVAQHLSPTYKSHLAELLARETLWPVVEIVHGLSLQAGRVYITPPDADVTLNDQGFELSPPASAIGPKPSANLLFASVAVQTQTLPIAVVLSGTGTDGADSLILVKEAGGWCLAHTPDHARYQGMPQAAIDTACVDYVLEPSEMGEQIAALIADPELLTRKTTDVLQTTSDAYQQIIALLTAHTGTNFLNYKPSTISRRLQKRLDYLEHHSYEDYLQGLHQNPSELDTLFKTMLIGVTRFFRDPEVFDVLNTHLFKILQQKNKGESLRIWVPGCASGEEAYSLAILIQELLMQQDLQADHFTLQIFATDISEASLSVARQGIYPKESLANLPDRLRQSYFQQLASGEYQVKQAIREGILFSRHDLTTNPPFFKLDLVSCRNLLIYFDVHLQQHIMPVFHFSLRPDGLLLLGKSETIGRFSKLFAPLNGPLRIFRRRSTLNNSSPLPFYAFTPVALSQPLSPPLTTPHEKALKTRLETSLVENYPCPYVVVNTALEILHIHGDVSPYLSLSAGRMSTHLLKLCHGDLQMELRSLSSQSVKENRRITGAFRRWPDSKSTLLLRLTLQPVRSDSDYDEWLVVIFETFDLEAQFVPALSPGDAAQDGGRIQELEHELKLTREYLHSTVEALEHSNEELQVINEELQSANEELQSANEELETTNEELQSMNEEMQVAYAELRTANEVLERKDLILKRSQANTQSILENSSQGVLLIDPRYHLMAFNTLAQQQQQLHFDILLQEGMSVIEAFDSEILSRLVPMMQQTLKQQVKTQQDFCIHTSEVTYWYTYSLLPVLKEKEVMGLTLSMQDVTDKVLAHQELEKSNALIDSVFDATSTGICVTDAEGFFVKVNQGYCDIYGYTAQELLGQHFTLVVIPEQRQMAIALHDAFIDGEYEMPGEWKVQAKDGHFIDVLTSARLLVNPDGSRCKVTTVYDISESKKYRDLLNDTQQAVGVGGWELDVIHNTIYWTPEVYGLPLDTPLDFEMAYGRYPKADRERLEQAMQKSVSAGVPFDLELQFYGANAQLIWVRTTCKPIRVYNKTVKLFGTFQDITERKLAEEDKSQLIYELTYKNEDLNQFTYIISHNLRAPVANLLGLVNLLELQAAEETDVLRHIKSSATQLDEVIQDLNQILSVRRQDQQDFYQQMDLATEIQALRESLAPDLKDLDAQITLDLQQAQVFTIRSYFHSTQQLRVS